MKEMEQQAKQSLKLQAYQYLKTKILNCEYRPNEFLNEQKLCAEMGNISRTPMRDALGRLEQEGLITILPKKGLMVSGITEDDVHSMFEMRLLVGEQRIMKYVADKGEKAVFQYVDEGRHCREHLHLKCVQCGRIYHLDCHFMDEVRAHLMAEHGFTLQCEGSVLYGLCRRCAQQNEQAEQTAENSNSDVDTDKKP
jgi:DNA-binding transcriptional regulator YhcF (GntR family)